MIRNIIYNLKLFWKFLNKKEGSALIYFNHKVKPKYRGQITNYSEYILKLNEQKRLKEKVSGEINRILKDCEK